MQPQTIRQRVTMVSPGYVIVNTERLSGLDLALEIWIANESPQPRMPEGESSLMLDISPTESGSTRELYEASSFGRAQRIADVVMHLQIPEVTCRR
jgi:hypothetical protein